ncbi:MAG: replication protein RepA [Gemmataceae bacterium]
MTEASILITNQPSEEASQAEVTDASAAMPTLTRHQRKLILGSSQIATYPPDRIDFLHTVQCQCGLPYRDPGNDIREWDQRQGLASMRIEAGSALDPHTREFVKLGLPFGEKPRLVLIYLASEAIRTQSALVDVEHSMTAFARSLGIATNGPHLRALKDQLSRLAAATIRMGMVNNGRAVQINTQIVHAMDLWFPTDPGQKMMWPSSVRLSNEYFNSLAKHAVPLDSRAVTMLSSSSMALDAYVWLSQRLHRLAPGKPQFIPWTAVHDQFGQGFARVRDFRRRFLHTLAQVYAAYPMAHFEADQRGLTLYHSRPPVLARSVSVPGISGA